MLMHQQQLGVPILKASQGTARGVMLAWRDWKKIVVAKNAMSDMVAGQTLGPGQAASSPSAQEGKRVRYQTITHNQTHQVKKPWDHQLFGNKMTLIARRTWLRTAVAALKFTHDILQSGAPVSKIRLR